MANDRGGWRVAEVEDTRVTERVAKWLNDCGRSSTLARTININHY